MLIKSSLVTTGAIAFGSVMVHGAALPIHPRDVAASKGASEVGPIILAPYNPRKKAPALAAASTFRLNDSPSTLQESETLYWFSDGKSDSY
jgi:hypothetical protein